MAGIPARDGDTVRIALLADVHGNSIALEHCLATVKRMRSDSLYFLGDLVGYLPGEQECLKMLQAADAICQQGNHEEMLLGARAGSENREEIYRLTDARARLSPEAIETLESWPLQRELRIAGRRILLVHGSPEDRLHGYVYPDSDLSPFQNLPYDAVLMAHTHRPFVARVGEKLVANVGSVGLPRDVGSLSAFAVYDVDANDISIYRVKLDIQAVLDRWGTAIHETTRECLHRDTPEFVGEVIA
jgi:predicted phosphodiesterase